MSDQGWAYGSYNRLLVSWIPSIYLNNRTGVPGTAYTRRREMRLSVKFRTQSYAGEGVKRRDRGVCALESPVKAESHTSVWYSHAVFAVRLHLPKHVD